MMRTLTGHKPKLGSRRRARIPARPARQASSLEALSPIAEAFDGALELDTAWVRVFGASRYREVASYFDRFI